MCFPQTIRFCSSVAENISSNLLFSITFVEGQQCCKRESHVSINVFLFLVWTIASTLSQPTDNIFCDLTLSQQKRKWQQNSMLAAERMLTAHYLGEK